MKNNFSLNIGGRLLTLQRPLIMGIMNVTDDSFYAESRTLADGVAARVKRMLDEGADIIDIGACSTRPGSEPVSLEKELERLHAALDITDREFPDAVVSIDTFRGKVVEECVARHNVAIVNDVSGYDWDKSMLQAVVNANIPYVLTHCIGHVTNDADEFIPSVIRALAQKMWQLHQNGVKDIIVDPGFGFGKSLEQNYRILESLNEFAILDAPLLVGVSRKSMITKLLDVQPADALNGTTVLNTIALMKGAHILRVHDVAAAVEVVKLCNECKKV